MKNKEYYTFAEIVMALRKHYRAVFDLLNQMKNCFVIDSKIYNGKTKDNDKFNSDFDLYLKKNNEDDMRFSLNVTRESSNHMVLTRQFLTQNTDHVHYLGRLSKNIDYYLTQGIRGCNKHFAIKLLVSNDSKEEYAKLFNKLYQLEICNALEEIICVNRFQNLKIDGSGIKLQFGYNHFDINYNAKADNISFKSKDNSYDRINYMKWNYYVNDILNTRIPRYEIPERYLKILENTELELKQVNILGPIGQNGTLSIKGDEKELVLTKSLNLDKIKK